MNSGPAHQGQASNPTHEQVSAFETLCKDMFDAYRLRLAVITLSSPTASAGTLAGTSPADFFDANEHWLHSAERGESETMSLYLKCH